ncbi:MAG: hypothetical protein KM310_05690 [Clostridiales bacterium]|nr:hypothetical protein [Clostridiales bacterium]
MSSSWSIVVKTNGSPWSFVKAEVSRERAEEKAKEIQKTLSPLYREVEVKILPGVVIEARDILRALKER